MTAPVNQESNPLNSSNIHVDAPNVSSSGVSGGNSYFQPGTPGSFAGQEILNNQETGAFVDLIPGNNRAGQLAYQASVLNTFAKALRRKTQIPAYSPIFTRETGGVFSPDNNVLSGIKFGDGIVALAATTALLTNLASVSVTQDGVTLSAGQELFVKNGAIPNVYTAAAYASTAALPANTYANGTLGVGATLTGNVNGALPAQDGQSITQNDRILVQFEANKTHNGLYAVTTVGDGSNAYVLTRVTDMENIATFIYGGSVAITAGTVYGGVTMLLSTPMVTVGTTAVTFTNLASKAGVLITHAFDGTYTVGTVSVGNAPLTRSTDMNTAVEAEGAVVTVLNGTVNGGFIFCNMATTMTLGVTPFNFVNKASLFPTAITYTDSGVRFHDTQVYFQL